MLAFMTDNDVEAVVAIVGLLTLLLTLVKGNQKIQKIGKTVEQQMTFNGNKSLLDGGTLAESLTRIEKNQAKHQTETHESLATISRRIGGVDDRLTGIDKRIDGLDEKMNHHIERTEGTR